MGEIDEAKERTDMKLEKVSQEELIGLASSESKVALPWDFDA